MFVEHCYRHWKCLYSAALLPAQTGSVCRALLQALEVFVEHCYRHWKCLYSTALLPAQTGSVCRTVLPSADWKCL